MVVKLTNINKKIQIIETNYEYINTLTKRFEGSNNSFFLVLVLIWHFSIISSHYTSITSSINLSINQSLCLKLITVFALLNWFFLTENPLTNAR